MILSKAPVQCRLNIRLYQYTRRAAVYRVVKAKCIARRADPCDQFSRQTRDPRDTEDPRLGRRIGLAWPWNLPTPTPSLLLPSGSGASPYQISSNSFLLLNRAFLASWPLRHLRRRRQRGHVPTAAEGFNQGYRAGHL
jgi:hypothetical protein